MTLQSGGNSGRAVIFFFILIVAFAFTIASERLKAESNAKLIFQQTACHRAYLSNAEIRFRTNARMEGIDICNVTIVLEKDAHDILLVSINNPPGCVPIGFREEK